MEQASTSQRQRDGKLFNFSERYRPNIILKRCVNPDCPQAGVFQPLDNFPVRNKRRGKVHGNCKPCYYTKQAAYRQTPGKYWQPPRRQAVTQFLTAPVRRVIETDDRVRT